MSNYKLEDLKSQRNRILKAEVGALIHNIGKFSEEFLLHEAMNQDPEYKKFDYTAIVGIIAERVLYAKLGNEESKRFNHYTIDIDQDPKTRNLLSPDQKRWLKERRLNLPAPLDDHSYALGDFIEFQADKWYKGSQPRIHLLFDSKSSHATELLQASHDKASGIEKEDKPSGEDKQNSWPPFYATAFGFESPMNADRFQDWRNKLLAALETDPRKKAFDLATSLLEKGVGDTRRPINEVKLSDLSLGVAGLFKSALAQVILNENWTSRLDLRWCLLCVNFDVLSLYVKAIKIADLLGYQERIDHACTEIKSLIEEECPLGNEVYRDTTGIYFTFPDIPLPGDLALEIRRRVEEIETELAPRITVKTGKGNTASDQLKRILAEQLMEAKRELSKPFSNEILSPCWQNQWENLPDRKWEVCPVCRLRPMKEHREACEHCLSRRESRVAVWKDNPEKTIWIDEIADNNDRLALIVGKFGLDNWLSGDLVQTMLVSAKENAPDKCTPKNPSPARLRRVWETTKRFWKDIVPSICNELSNQPRSRLELVPDTPLEPDMPPREIACDGTLNGQSISVFRIGDRLLTISLVKEPMEGTLRLSWEKNGHKRRIEIDNIKARKAFESQELSKYNDYLPFMPLLASPDQFLALIPASEALKIAENIRQEYTKQFSKVQNRLPLFLGLVFFQRRMPLAAVMDTAQRMLALPLSEEGWEVVKNTERGKDDAAEYLQVSNHFEKWNDLILKYGEKQIHLAVSTVMGDGNTKDEWYPYFFIDGQPTSDHKRRFQLKKEGMNDSIKIGDVSKTYADRWLVHVEDLHPDDNLLLTPSRFAYLYLEHTAQRFEFSPQEDVVYIDELPYLWKMWKYICETPDMTDTRLQGIWSLLDAKWAMWRLDEKDNQDYPDRLKTFCQLSETILRRDKLIQEGRSAVTVDDIVTGRFRRCLELHLKILKQRVKGDKHEQQRSETV